MDEIDRKIVKHLQLYPRRSNTLLAKALGIGQATVRRRIENLTSSGIITFTALPNLEKFGYPVRAYFFLRVESGKLSSITDQLCSSPALRSVISCVGQPDLFVRGDFKSNRDLADFIVGFLNKVEGISHVETLVELQAVKLEYDRIDMPNTNREGTREDALMTIDEADRRLIVALQKDCRTPLKILASRVGASRTTIHRRIKELTRSGYIELTVMSNLGRLGYPARCALSVETNPQKADDVARWLARHPRVHYVGVCSGPAQVLAAIHAASYASLWEIVSRDLKSVEGVNKVGVFVFAKTIRQSFTWLPAR